MSRTRRTLAFLSTLLPLVVSVATGEGECSKDDAPCSDAPSRVPDGCRLVFAESSNSNTNTNQWGVYSLTSRPKGTPVWSNYGDVVIQWTSPLSSLLLLLEDNDDSLLAERTWKGQETGGQNEGANEVHSIVPGLGMLTRTTADKYETNLLPFVPRVDEGGLTRFDSPGAGAITHYHNYTWYFQNDVDAGDELVMAASLRHKTKASTSTDTSTMPVPALSKPTVEELYQHGYCLDNARPRKSRIKEAGRGAYATRNIEEGAIVAPVPVMALQKNSKTEKELLLNYCFGHKNSSLLLYPYGPYINLINHYNEPNTKLQWSQRTTHEYFDVSAPLLPLPLLSKDDPFLLMELVATRPIAQGDELYLDYGHEWEDAWWEHVNAWQPFDMHYTPSYVMDDAIRLLRTQKEQKEHPYPTNLDTSCFYRYSDRKEDEKQLHQPESSSKANSKSSIQGFRWKLSKGLYDLKHMRPCQVLRRNEDAKGRSAYAVRMFNRPGLEDGEVIPKGELHIVTHVPRSAVRLTDKIGTTDQHLPSAFRHELGLDIFPTLWMDLAEKEEEDKES